MALQGCPDCGRQVSTGAASCPQCGRVLAAPRGRGRLLEAVGAFLSIGAFLGLVVAVVNGPAVYPLGLIAAPLLLVGLVVFIVGRFL